MLFYTGGTLEMDDQKKADFLSFIHDDGKGFIGIHSATITFTDWPEYGEMIGGYFDEHPWGTFDAPIIVEDPGFPRDAAVAPVVCVQRRDLPDPEFLARQGARADAAGCEQAGSEQSRASIARIGILR